MQIAQSKTREQFPLSTRKVLKKTIASTLALVLFALFIIGVLWATFAPAIGLMSQDVIGWLSRVTIGIIGFLVAFIVLTYFYQRWYFAVYFYDLTSDYIQIKKGPITPHEITLPYERIQDIYVDQDVLDRLFGLYDVHLSSATFSSGMAAHIDGVEKQAAEGLRALLLQTVKERISKHKGERPSL